MGSLSKGNHRSPNRDKDVIGSNRRWPRNYDRARRKESWGVLSQTSKFDAALLGASDMIHPPARVRFLPYSTAVPDTLKVA